MTPFTATEARPTQDAIEREVRYVAEAMEFVRERPTQRVMVAGLLHGEDVLVLARRLARAADVRILLVPAGTGGTIDIQVEHRTALG